MRAVAIDERPGRDPAPVLRINLELLNGASDGPRQRRAALRRALCPTALARASATSQDLKSERLTAWCPPTPE